MKKLRADLEQILDDAVERGLTLQQVREVAVKRFISFTLEETEKKLDIWFRFAANVFCLLVPAAIYGLKYHAAGSGRPMPNDELLNWTCLVCYVAVMANSVATLMPLLQMLLKFLTKNPIDR